MPLYDRSQTPPVNQQNPKDAALGLNFLREHELKIDSIKELTLPPDPGEIIFLWTEKSFNAFTFIPYLIGHFGQIEELVISTYSINKRILNAFIRLFSAGQIQKIEMLVADSLQHMRPKVYDELSTFALQNQEHIKVRYAWNHSKITLVKTVGQCFVIEGSGNWSENSRHEQYIFSNSEQLYNFRKKCVIVANP